MTNNNKAAPVTQANAIPFVLTFTTQSSEPDAMTLSLCGHQAISRTGPLCPPTSGWSAGMRPTCEIQLGMSHLFVASATLTHFVVGKNDECTTASWLDDDGQKLWIHRTECWVPTALWYTNIVVALFALQCLSIHMTKFWTSHNPKWHDDYLWLLFSFVLVTCSLSQCTAKHSDDEGKYDDDVLCYLCFDDGKNFTSLSSKLSDDTDDLCAIICSLSSTLHTLSNAAAIP